MKILALNNKVVIVNGKPLQIQDPANLTNSNENNGSSNSSSSTNATPPNTETN